MEFQFERVPRWIVVVGVAGTLLAGVLYGRNGALGFLLGAAGSWWNYASLVRVVKSLAKAAAENSAAPVMRATASMFLRLGLVAAAVLVILKYSKISLIALLVGLFASCIAIGLEILVEAVWTKSAKSG